ncbi:MAG TPA: hypothetical protein VHQ98_05975 [Gaiellaceae bacterium]|nr:hypothetical protein [Gaiellaceae bacterium]
MSLRRSACLGGLAAALAAPVPASAAVQQVLLPGPTPYPTQSPPLTSAGATSARPLPITIHARVAERVHAGVGPDGEIVSLRALHRLALVGRGDYLIVIGAPVEDVHAGPGSQSEPGLRVGQILWSGFSPGTKLLVADAELSPGAAARFLPLRLHVTRDGGRYSLTVTNATVLSEDAYEGNGFPRQLAQLLDRTRAQSLAGTRLDSAYASVEGRVRRRPARIAAPVAVQGVLRFPTAPTSVRGGTLRGRSVSFSTVLGDADPLSLRVDVRGGGTPHLRLLARPTKLVRALTPPAASSWVAAVRRRAIPSRVLLRTLIDARMQLVRSDQYQTFLANPDPQGAATTVYVYESAAAPTPKGSPPAESGSGNGDALVLTLALVGSVLGIGVALVIWAHS